MRYRTPRLFACLLGLGSLLPTRPALAWELFRSESSAVERGNEHLAKGQPQEALEAYDEAARELPDDPAVQLNRGLALKSLNKLAEAREAFRRAGAASAPKEVRGPALYDLGLTFMQEADMAGKAEDFDGAKKLLEESVDAFRSSLRAQPGDRGTAWNLELAKRRLVDVKKKQEEKKKQEDEKKKDEQNKDEQNKDEQNKDEQNKDEQNKDEQNKDPKQDDEGKDGAPDAGSPASDGGSSPDQGDGQGEPDAGASAPEPEAADAGAPKPPADEQEAEQPTDPQKQEPNALPEHMKRALDALEAGEENLEKLRARQRARSRPRRIDKDW
jgi:Ca-activated chloride channel homolog